MTDRNRLLEIRFAGEAIGAGKIPLSHLLPFLTNMNKAFQRTGRILQGDLVSVRRGKTPHNIKTEVDLNLVSLTHGSPTAVLGFERNRMQSSIPGMDLGLEVLEKTVCGLQTIQQDSCAQALPDGYDSGVLMAWRDAGGVFNRGVDSITLTLNHREKPLQASLTEHDFNRIQDLIEGPKVNILTIEGRLLMADFKEHGTRCRIHPSTGEPVLCLFDDGQKDEVLDNILQYVRVVGEGKEDSLSGQITSIRIHDIKRLEDREHEAIDLLPQGTPVSHAFWESPTIEELACSQEVRPMTDVRALFGTWPGEKEDGFEEAIDELRHSDIEVGGRL